MLNEALLGEAAPVVGAAEHSGGGVLLHLTFVELYKKRADPNVGGSIVVVGQLNKYGCTRDIPTHPANMNERLKVCCDCRYVLPTPFLVHSRRISGKDV